MTKEILNGEMMNEEQLDKVSGGRNVEFADDSRFLNVLLRGRPGQCDRYGEWKAMSHGDEIVNAWKSVGIDIVYHKIIHSGPDGLVTFKETISDYSLNGKTITRAAAFAHAEEVVGKHLQKSDWKW